jgi:hypothetical protein
LAPKSVTTGATSLGPEPRRVEAITAKVAGLEASFLRVGGVGFNEAGVVDGRAEEDDGVAEGSALPWEIDSDKLTPEQLDCIAEHLIKKSSVCQSRGGGCSCTTPWTKRA